MGVYIEEIVFGRSENGLTLPVINIMAIKW